MVGQWAYAVATRIASIVKERVDGTLKLRFGMDLLRSGVNGRSDPPERTVLPRMTDFINGILDLIVVQWQRGGDKQALERIGMMVIDFSDAFYLLHAKPSERAWLVFKCARGWAVFRRVCFGMTTAPLLWGRVAAAAARIAQAAFRQEEVRIQIFVDDPATAVAGSLDTQRHLVGLLLLLWSVLGLKVNWKKGQFGKKVDWIGATVSVQLHAKGPAVRT